MFLLFGTHPSQSIVNTVTFDCNYCGQHATQNVVKVANKFTIFFIPLFTFGKSFYVQCSNCGGVTDLTEAQANHSLEWAAKNRSVA